MDDLLTAKLLALTALTSASLAVGLAPLCCARSAHHAPSLRSAAATSLALCAGAGVLLATALAHILPELRAQLADPEPVFCAGFFAMQLAEEAVHWLQGKSQRCQSEGQPLCTANDESVPLLNPAPSTGVTSTLGLLAALSIHSALEGVAVGLQATPPRVWLLTGAVAAHKLAVGLCLGLELRGHAQPRKHAIAVAVFAGSCAVGVATGAIAQVGSAAQLPWLQALAGGSLLYVAVSEVLPRERARLQGRARWAGLAQLAAAVAGFCLALALSRLVDEGAEPDEGV